MPRPPRLAPFVLVAALGLAGCGGSDGQPSSSLTDVPSVTTASPASPAPGATVAATPGASPSSGDGSGDSGTSGGGNGCVPNSAQVPAGAHLRKGADLDLDGDADSVWLAAQGTRRLLGVRTATGAVFSVAVASAAPQAATATGQRMAPAGPALVLLDTGRSVLVFDVVDCKLVPTTNAQGRQYAFDLGFTGFGTGVACVAGGDGYTPAGLLAKPSGGTYTVYRTPITLSDFGRRARNGTRVTLATDAQASSSVVRQAQSVSCGSGTATVTEPNS